MKKLTVAICLCIALSSSACVGSFALFNRLQDWNQGVSDKWVNSAVHTAFWIVQVYELCLLGDLLIFNTVEFWTGDNPVQSASVGQDDEGLLWVVVDDRRYELRSVSESSVAVWRDGTYLGVATRTAEGGWVLVDELNARTLDVSQQEANDLLAMLTR